MNETLELRPDEAAQALIPALRTVVVPTDATDDGMARARSAATQLAAEHGWELILYDRSAERWTDTPHPSGLLAVAEIDADERAHLAQQMSDIEAAGVEVRAWLATVPALSAMIDVFQAVEVDGVVVPDELEQPRLTDRLQPGSGPADTVNRIVGRQLGGRRPEFLIVDPAGTVTVVTPTVTTSTEQTGVER